MSLLKKKLSLPVQKLKALKTSSLLHDIGELNIPDFILNKANNLTTNEFNPIKDHPIYSSKLIMFRQFTSTTVIIILYTY